MSLQCDAAFSSAQPFDTDRGGGAAGGSSKLARGRQSFGERTTTLLQGAAEKFPRQKTHCH